MHHRPFHDSHTHGRCNQASAFHVLAPINFNRNLARLTIGAVAVVFTPYLSRTPPHILLHPRDTPLRRSRTVALRTQAVPHTLRCLTIRTATRVAGKGELRPAAASVRRGSPGRARPAAGERARPAIGIRKQLAGACCATVTERPAPLDAGALPPALCAGSSRPMKGGDASARTSSAATAGSMTLRTFMER